jgi:hypothetical protein
MNNTDNSAEYFAFKDDPFLHNINNVRGHVMNDNGNSNILNIISNARFYSFDKYTETVTVLVDDYNVPGFWLKIPIKLFDINKWIDNPEIYNIKDVKGRVMDDDRNINTDIDIDSAQFSRYNKYTKIINIRIEDSHVPGFWVDLPIELPELYLFIQTYYTNGDHTSRNVGNDGIVSPIDRYNRYGNAIKCMKCDSLCHVQKDCINVT